MACLPTGDQQPQTSTPFPNVTQQLQFQSPSSNTFVPGSPEVIYSGKHNGLCLYLSRILRCVIYLSRILRCVIYLSRILRCVIYLSRILRCVIYLSRILRCVIFASTFHLSYNCLKSVCRRSQTAGRNSCSIASGDVSN